MQAYDNDVDAGDSDDAGVLEGPDAFGASRAAFDELLATLGSAKAAGWTHDQLEEQLETDGRELLRRLYQDHLDLRALREQHAVATGRIGPSTDARGIAHRKVEPGHLRHLATVFGTVRVTRCAWRAEGARNLYPADAALNLPDRRHSHTLKRRAATEAVRGSFAAAEQTLTRACGKVAGKRQVKQLTVAAATDIDAFYTAAAPQPATDDTLLVLSVDGKGIVMRPDALREPTRKAAAVKGANRYRTRLASGEKQGRKRMATLGTVYDADPAPRRPHDVMTPAITLHAAPDGAGAGRWRPPPARPDPRPSRPPQGDHPHPGRPHPRPRIHLESGLVLLPGRRSRRRTLGRRPRPAHPGRRGRHRHRRTPDPGHRRRAHRPAARRCRCLHRLPDRQTGVPGLRHRPSSRLADRHRRDRRGMPASDRRPARHHRRRWGLEGAEAVL